MAIHSHGPWWALMDIENVAEALGWTEAELEQARAERAVGSRGVSPETMARIEQAGADDDQPLTAELSADESTIMVTRANQRIDIGDVVDAVEYAALRRLERAGIIPPAGDRRRARDTRIEQSGPGEVSSETA